MLSVVRIKKNTFKIYFVRIGRFKIVKYVLDIISKKFFAAVLIVSSDFSFVLTDSGFLKPSGLVVIVITPSAFPIKVCTSLSLISVQ